MSQSPFEKVNQNNQHSIISDSVEFDITNCTDSTYLDAKQLPLPFEDKPRKMWLYDFSKNLILNKHFIIFCGLYYVFNGWYYEEDKDINSSRIIASLLTIYIKYPLNEDVVFVKKIIKANAGYIEADEIPNRPDYIIFNNVQLHTNSGNTLPLGSSYFATGAINARYNPQLLNTPLMFDNILLNIAGGDYELYNRIWEVIAYILSPEYRYRYIFCFIGVGGSGKSLLLKVIEHLLTPSLTVNMSIQNLVGSRFALSELVGKRVCFASDEGSFKISNEASALLKRISGGGETITADVKGQRQVTFTSTAKLLIASNNSIHVSAAQIDPFLHGRMVVVPFTVPIAVENQDTNLLEKILAERDAIVTKAYQIFRSLQANNFCFSGNERKFQEMADAVTRQYSFDPLVIFSEEYCEFNENAFTPTQELYSRFTVLYPDFFKDETAFSRAFYSLNQHKLSRKRHHSSKANIRGFCGVNLKGEKNENNI